MITYYLNGVYFCECLEGSMMDLSIQAAVADQAVRYGKLVRRAVEQGKPIPLPEQVKDVLCQLQSSV